MVERAVEQYIETHPGRNAEACAAAFKPHRPGITREESTSLYDAWAASGMYEEDLNEERYKGPEFASRALGELFPSDRDHWLILDVACGTGMVSEKLQKLGFRRIHGIDPSPQMLETARQKAIYEQLFPGYLDGNPLPMDDNTYDGAVISGGIGSNLIPVEGMKQLVRVVKPGGYVVIAAREKYAVEDTPYRDLLDQEMTSMEAEGVWRLVSMLVMPKYSFDNDGVVWKYMIILTGGYVVIAAREKYAVEDTPYRDLLDQEMTSMEAEGVWRLVSMLVMPKYSFDNDGVVWKYMVC